MELFQRIILEVIIALGGNVAVILLFLKFFKGRIEKFIDTQIETRADAKLKKFESDLEKRKLYFEEAVKKEQDSLVKMIDFYNKVIPDIRSIVSLIETVSTNSSAFSSVANAVFECSNRINEENVCFEKSNIQISIYTDQIISSSHEQIIKTISKCISMVDNCKGQYDIELNQKQELLDIFILLEKKIEGNLKNIRNCIKRKA